jgi:hypothetical protein
VGNGTSNFGTLTGGTVGQVATWNGSQWTAATPTTGGVTTVSAGTGISVTGTSTNPIIGLSSVLTPGNYTNASVSVNGSGVITSVSTGSSGGTGTVTSVTGTGTASGLSLSGTVTTSGNITLSGTVNSLAAGTYAIGISGNAATATTASGLTGSPAITVSSVTSSGNVQAYSGSNYSALQSQSIALFNSNTGMSCDGTTFSWQFSSALRMQLNSSGQAFNSTGTWGTISDARIKENVTPARDYLNDVCQLEVVNYYIKDEPQKMLGFVAQQVETVMPGLVDTSDNKYYNISDFKSVKTTVLIPMLVQAIQELKAGLDEAKAEIAALKGS